MNVQQDGDIAPWKQQFFQLQPEILRKRLKTAQFSIRPPKSDMNKTSPNIYKKMKTEQVCPHFKDQPNQARIITLDFNKEEINKSNLRQAVLGAKRQQFLHFARKKSIKAMTITSIKKQLSDLKIAPNSSNYPIIPYRGQKEVRNQSEPRIIQTIKQMPEQLQMKQTSLKISRVKLQRPHQPVDHQFFNQIANLSRQKKKILTRSGKKSFNSEMKVQRELFMKHNKKFKSWHKLNLRLTSSPIRSHLYSTLY